MNLCGKVQVACSHFIQKLYRLCPDVSTGLFGLHHVRSLMNYFCTGRVLPERAAVSFSPIEFSLEDGARAVVSCDASQISVAIEHPTLDGWIAAQMFAVEVASLFVSALGFALGSGYSVEMTQVTEADGTSHVFGVRPTGEPPRVDLAVQPDQEIFNAALRLSGKDVFFRLAVRDYLRAMTDIRDCATYCYRAIEGIRCAFVSETGVNSWDDMHAALGTTREEIIAKVKSYADPVRHGNWVNQIATDKFQRWKMLCLTRDILSSYLNLRKTDV